MNIASAAYSAAKTELQGMRGPLRVFVAILFLIVAGDDIEGRLAPVLRDMRLLRADVVHSPTEGRQLCFDYETTKARTGIGTVYVAQVYVNDEMRPVIRGVIHRDGTPFGGRRANSPPQRTVIDYCVSIGHAPETFERLGVRMRIEWEVPWRPWLLRQTFWTDYYPDKPETK